MQKVLVAGGSGLLGKQVILELKRRGYQIRALVRNPSKLQGFDVDEIVTADLTDATSLKGICDGVDYVFSCAGAVMNVNDFKQKTSFYDVDYKGNLNLLAEAKQAKVKKFAYVSLAGAEKLLHTEYADAHEKFVQALKSSGLDFAVIRPTGFFGFLLEILKFAKKGRGLLIGDGNCLSNPIHEADLAKACVDTFVLEEKEISIGGPRVFTRRQITELAFTAINRTPKLMSISPGLFKILIAPLKLINRRIYALMDFGIAVTQIEVIAPDYGSNDLHTYFVEAAKEL
jgi:uncharacterized protein YbjT (DUF2867 family)